VSATTAPRVRRCTICLNPSDAHTRACRRNPANDLSMVDRDTAYGIRHTTDGELRRLLDTVPESGVGSPLHQALSIEAARRGLPASSTCPIHGEGCEAWT
jgi:hypothetical protein